MSRLIHSLIRRCEELGAQHAARVLVGIWLFIAGAVVKADERANFFEAHIRPVLVKSCYECHSSTSEEPEGKLRLDYRGGLLKGGESGPAIVVGKPEKSLLMAAIKHQSLKMPPSDKLSDKVVADFEKWIRDGAVDPRDQPSKSNAVARSWSEELAKRSRWWSLQSPQATVPPECEDANWSREPVDRFIYSSLINARLKPAKPASAQVLLRRLSFVLTGLPPEPSLVHSFPQAYARDPELALNRLVDQLLESPHFGERFARQWMDVVRYTDTYGYEWDIAAKGSWEYRDYLIRAFNRDVGFDQLIREQIAGDLLERPRINDREGLNESMIGPMFYHMGEHRHGSSLAFNGIHQEMIDNKIDAFSKAFLAMTVACARCHDHKLDAVAQTDYYALAGMFMTPRWTARSIDSPDKHATQIAKLKKLRSEIRRQLGDAWKADRGPLASAASLRQWAIKHRAELAKAKPEDVAWPLRQLVSHRSWLPVEELNVKAAAEATTLAIQPDGSVLAGGPVPAKDSYTATFTTSAGRASVIRLEALTHKSLGKGGPGRTAHGNFVLSQISVSVTPMTKSKQQGKPRAVQLVSAAADYSQPNYPVSTALKKVVGPGWGVGLGGNVNRTAQFDFAEPIDLPNGGRWMVRLEFQYGSKHILGRFRLAVGGDAMNFSEADSGNQEATERWAKLADEWRKRRATRLKSNENFTTLIDFSKPGLPDGWITDGAGFEHGYVRSATPLISLKGDQLVDGFLAAGYHTRALSPRLPGALRVPNLKSLGTKVTVRLNGGEWAGYRNIPQNAFLNEGPRFFDPNAAPAWTTLASPGLRNGVTRVLTEITTAGLNSNFPPRTGVANAGGVRLLDKDDGHDKLSWFSVTGLVSSSAGGSPADPLNEFTALYDSGDVDSSRAGWQRLQTWLVATVDRWAADQSVPSDVKLLNWMLDRKILKNDRKSLSTIAKLADQYRSIEETIELPRSVNSMDERGVAPIDYRLNIRGDVYREGDPIPRNFLQVFAKRHDVRSSSGSGRLELAKFLSSRDNPQTARVYVNRVWQWIFGSGIVETPSDFGKLGGRPSHRELLDWLAIQFMNEGWSTKKLVRRLVLSQTFRQGGGIHQEAADRDPANRLRHHYPTRRLEAEAIRDSLLATSGSLDVQLYGRPIRPQRTVEDAKKRLFSGPMDGKGRRSVYIEMSIMEPPKFLVGFNLPDMKLPTGRRDETKVPAQALMMLNHPFVIQQADYWGQRLVEDESKNVEDRIRRMFVRALGRNPAREELKLWGDAVKSFARSTNVLSDVQAWAELAHAFYNTTEFIYYR